MSPSPIETVGNSQKSPRRGCGYDGSPPPTSRRKPSRSRLAEPTLEERSGVDAGRCVALEEDLVTEARVGLAAKEVVEPDLVEGGGRRVRREVAADSVDASVRSAPP